MALGGSGKLLSIGMVAPQVHALRVGSHRVLSGQVQTLPSTGQVTFKPVTMGRD